MELVKKSDNSEKEIIPIMEEYSKKTDSISKQQIFKCQFVAGGNMQNYYLKFYSPAARLKLMQYEMKASECWEGFSHCYFR
eukprot:snap_masked-scaffold_49-processed-gene-1.85-mRNA-1 protein AED:1.00 eAED:1.00 QI:0/0/0/0/1/1/2/0/80